jgi:hypothetical protein
LNLSVVFQRLVDQGHGGGAIPVFCQFGPTFGGCLIGRGKADTDG